MVLKFDLHPRLFLTTTLTHFWPMLPFYNSVKTLEKTFSGIFRRYKMKTLARNGLTAFDVYHKNILG